MSNQFEKDIEWTEKKFLEYAESFFNVYIKKIKEKPDEAIAELLSHVALLSGQVQQLKEAFYHNHKVSKGAFDNSHLSVEKYQELDGMIKTIIPSMSKRLEKLENEQRRY